MTITGSNLQPVTTHQGRNETYVSLPEFRISIWSDLK